MQLQLELFIKVELLTVSEHWIYNLVSRSRLSQMVLPSLRLHVLVIAADRCHRQKCLDSS